MAAELRKEVLELLADFEGLRSLLTLDTIDVTTSLLALYARL